MEGFGALGINIPSLIAQLFNFLLLLFLLWRFAYKPVLGMLDRRSQRIRESLEAAERAKQDSARAEEQVAAQLAAARKDAQAIAAQASQAAAQVQQEARDQARREADVIIARARDEIARERDEAMEAVRRQFAVLAVAAAQRIVGERLDATAHRRLIDEVLQEANLGGPRGA